MRKSTPTCAPADELDLQTSRSCSSSSHARDCNPLGTTAIRLWLDAEVWYPLGFAVASSADALDAPLSDIFEDHEHLLMPPRPLRFWVERELGKGTAIVLYSFIILRLETDLKTVSSAPCFWAALDL